MTHKNIMVQIIDSGRSKRLAILALGLLSLSPARAQLFTVDTGVDTVSEYGTDGSTINDYFVPSGVMYDAGPITNDGTNLFVLEPQNETVDIFSPAGKELSSTTLGPYVSVPAGIAVSGNDVFISDYDQGQVLEFDTAGNLVNYSFIGGLTNPGALVISNGALFVAQGNGTIGEYNLSSGTAINANLITSSTVLNGLPPSFSITSPSALAVSGLTLYVGQYANSLLSSFNINSGANIANLTGVSPGGLAIAGSSLYFTETYGWTIDKVDLALDASSYQYDIANTLQTPEGLTYLAAATPEPPLWLLLLGGLLLTTLVSRPRKTAPAS